MNSEAHPFNNIAKTYKQDIKNNLKYTGFDIEYITEYKIKDLKYVVEKYLNYKKLNILNFGCGIGLSDPYLEKYFPNSKIFSCDISANSIEIAKSNKLNVQYKLCDTKEIPFDEIFDVILVANVIRHIPPQNRIDTLSMLKKVLSSNGIIFIYEFNPYNPVGTYFHFKYDKKIDKNIKIITLKDTKKLINTANLSVLESKYRFFIPNFFKNFLFIENYLDKVPFGANYYLVAKNKQ